MIELSDVSFSYGQRDVIKDVSGSLGPGVVGLVGVNGAGKTTLLRMLATITRPDHGRILCNGLDLADRKSRKTMRKQLGYLPQASSWSAGFTVVELCHYFAWLRGVPRADRAVRVAAAIEAVGLSDRARDRLGELSGGQYQRAMIAQACAHDPAILILDEPTSGLDPQQRVAFRSLLREIGDRRTVVLSTHLIEDVSHAADQVAVLHQGRFAFNGSVDDLEKLAYRNEPGDNPLEQAFHRVISDESVL